MNHEYEEGAINMWVIVAVAIVIGLGGGYYFGYSKGQSDLLAAQKEAAQVEIAQKANPFETAANPVGGAYTNPFEGGGAVNPFR